MNNYHRYLDAKINAEIRREREFNGSLEHIEQLLKEVHEALEDVREMRQKLEEKKGNANKD